MLSYSFREAAGRSCSIEMQVKSGANNWIQFTKPYTPGADGWDRVVASLGEFVQPEGIGAFDPASVQGIALNVRVYQTNVIYVGFFDDVYFATPETIVPIGVEFGHYQSSDDSVAPDTWLDIESLPAGPDRLTVLSWLARSNYLYSVEYRGPDLNKAEPFRPLAGLTNLMVRYSGRFQVIDTNAPSSAARFYRLRIQPH